MHFTYLRYIIFNECNYSMLKIFTFQRILGLFHFKLQQQQQNTTEMKIEFKMMNVFVNNHHFTLSRLNHDKRFTSFGNDYAIHYQFFFYLLFLLVFHFTLSTSASHVYFSMSITVTGQYNVNCKNVSNLVFNCF